MRIKDEVFGKEVLDSEIQIVGKVSDVIFKHLGPTGDETYF